MRGEFILPRIFGKLKKSGAGWLQLLDGVASRTAWPGSGTSACPPPRSAGHGRAVAFRVLYGVRHGLARIHHQGT